MMDQVLQGVALWMLVLGLVGLGVLLNWWTQWEGQERRHVRRRR